MPPIPRPEVVQRVAAYLSRFKSDIDVRALQRGKAEGTAFEVAQVKENPRALLMENRIPHIMDRDGEVLWSGEQSTLHRDGVEEAYAKARLKNPNVRPDRFVYVSENPQHVTWELRDFDKQTSLTDQELTSVVKALQTKFAKPVIDPNPANNKIYGVGAGATGATVASQEDKEQDPLYQIYLNAQKQVSDPLKIVYDTAQKGIQDREQLQDELPSEIAETISQQQRLISKIRTKYRDLMTQYPDVENPMLSDLVTAYTGVAEFQPDIERGVRSLAATPSTIEQEGLTVRSVTQPIFGALDLLGFGAIGAGAARWASKWRRPLVKENISRVPSEEQVLRDFAKERVHTPEGLSEPAIRKAEALEFEFDKYYTPSVKELEQEATQGFSRAFKTRAEQEQGATNLRALNKEFGAKKPKEKPITQPEVETLLKQLDPETGPGKAPSVAHSVANESQQTMLIMGKEHPLWKQTQRRFLASTTYVLLKAGPIGREIIKKVHNYQDASVKQASQAMRLVHASLKPLSKKERNNLFEMLNESYYLQSIRPLSQRVQDAYRTIATEQIKATTLAKQWGLEATENPRGFIPHILTKDKLNEKEFLAYVKNTEQAVTENEARLLFNTYAKRYADMKFKGLEQARTLHIRGKDNYKKLGFETELAPVLSSYFNNAYRRIEAIKQFGDEGHKGFDLLKAQLAHQQPNDASIAEALFRHVTKRNELDTLTQKLLSKTINFHVITFMGMAGPLQLSQLGNIALRMGWRNAALGTYRGMKGLLRKGGDEFVERTGALSQTVAHDIKEMYSQGWMTDQYLKITGVTPLDNLTRRFAVHAGDFWLDDIVRGLQAGKNTKYWTKAADELFIDIPTLAKQNWKFAQDERDVLLKRLSDTTAGRTRPTEMPNWASSDVGKLVLLFKKFMIFQTRFMKDYAFKPLVARDTPLGKRASILSAFVLGQYPLGSLLGEVRSIQTGKERPEGLKKVIDNLAFVQAFGIWADIASAAGRGEAGIGKWAAGPIVNNTSQWLSAFWKSLDNVSQGYTTEQDHKQLVKKMAQQTIRPVPWIGPRMYTELLDQMYPEMRIKERPTPRR